MIKNSPMNQFIKNLVNATKFPFLVKINFALCGLFFNFLATQQLTPEAFGLFSIAQVIILFSVAFAKFGLDAISVRLIAQSESKNLLLALSKIILVCTITTSLILFCLSDLLAIKVFNKEGLSHLFPLIAMIIIPNGLVALMSAVFKGLGKATLSLCFNGLVTLLCSIGFLLLFNVETAKQLLNIVLISNIIALLFSVLFIIKHCNMLSFKEHVPFQKEIFRPAISLWLVALVSLVIQQSQVLVLAVYSTDSDVAIYAIAFKLASLCSFFLAAINTVYAPKLAILSKNKDSKSFYKLFISIQKTMVLLALALGVIGFLLAEFALSLFGDIYTQGTTVLMILLFGQLVNLSCGPVVTAILMSGYESLHKKTSLVIGIFTVILSFYLIPIYGILGAAIVTAAMMSLQNVISLILLNTKVLTK